jgi:hypothetical protein
LVWALAATFVFDFAFSAIVIPPFLFIVSEKAQLSRDVHRGQCPVRFSPLTGIGMLVHADAYD